MDPRQEAGTASTPMTREPGEGWSLDRVSFTLFTVLAALIPVGFLPFLSVQFPFTKTALAALVTLIMFALFVVARLKEGALPVPHNMLLVGLWAVPFTALLSAIFASPDLGQSFFGQRLESDTVLFLILMALLTTLTPVVVRSKQRMLTVYTGLLISFAILVLYQGLRLMLGPTVLSFDILTTTTSNLIGKWNDLGVFFGLTAMLALTTLEGLRLRPVSHAVLYVTLGLSLFFVAVVNFTPVWITLGLFALGLLIYTFFRDKLVSAFDTGEPSHGSMLKRSKISIFAIIVLVLAGVFTIFNTTVGNALPTYFEISNLEVRPSWQGTSDVLKATYADSAILGSGPNTFAIQWAFSKPQGVNETLFWSTDFGSGIGYIPTAFVTTGIFGALAWIAFLGLLVYLGIRALVLRPAGEGFAYYLILSSFIASIYLWVFQIIYVPSAPITILAFIFTGLFLASLRHHVGGVYQEKRFVFAENPRLGFVSVLGLAVALILTAVALFTLFERYVSSLYFQSAVYAVNTTGDLDNAERLLNQALSFAEYDTYYQLGTEIGLARLNQIFNSQTGTVDERRAQFQEELASTIGFAQRATQLRANNYQNWLSLGRVYQSVVPLQIQGAYDSALSSYEKARALAPHQPQVYLSLAELEAVNQNIPGAKAYIETALAEKSNYTAAVFLLAQLQIAEGDIPSAIKSVEAGAMLDPENPVVFFQLGLLYYNQGNIEGSIAAFERAVQLNDTYANARYFLGLSYHLGGRDPEAIAQFERVYALNPGNQEVELILSNLRAGKEPFAGALSGSENPEDRDTPPIKGE